jgi:putative hydrolase of the HAD superfamily
VRAVLFDFYGTLARAVTWGARFEDVFARRGLDVERHVWDDSGEVVVYDGQDHVAHSRSREDYVAWELERLRQRVAACGVVAADIEPLVAELYAESKAFTLEAFPEVPAVLAELRKRGTTVAVCSNWDWDLEPAMAGAGLEGAADVVVTSARAGARKPHPLIYRLTLERCGVPPTDALFVGDTWVPDVEGPLAAGMRAVHVLRNGVGEGLEPPPLVEGASRLPDLRGVLDLT